MTSQPQAGDFAITTVRGNVGFLISLGERLLGSRWGHWDHAFVYVGDGQLVEAEPGGARLAGLDEYQGRPLLWSTGRVELTGEQRASIVAAARARIGTPYSALDYLAIAAHRFHLPIPGLRKYIASTGHEICSALVDRVYADAGVHLYADGRWEGYVTPADLAALIGA